MVTSFLFRQLLSLSAETMQSQYRQQQAATTNLGGGGEDTSHPPSISVRIVTPGSMNPSGWRDVTRRLHPWARYVSKDSAANCPVVPPASNAMPNQLHVKKNSMVWVRERTIPTERPPLVGEAIANFCWQRMPRGQRDGSLRPYSRFSRQEPLLFYQVAPQLYSRGWVDPVPDPLHFFFL
jgi:hypothetical protein